MRARPYSIWCALSLGVVACGSASPPPEPPRPPATPPEPPVAQPAAPTLPSVTTTLDAVGLDGAALDRKAEPCQDFYQFACGKWIERTEIPADKPLWSRSFSVIAEHNEAAVHQILDDAAAGKGGDESWRDPAGSGGSPAH